MDEDRQDQADREQDDFSLSHTRVKDILLAINRGDAPGLGRLLDQLHPADVADLMEQVGDGTRRLLLRFWGREIDGEILSELDESLRAEVLAALPPEAVSEALLDLDSDDIVDLVEDLEDADQEMVLEALPAADRRVVEEALAYPEFSAGRLMQREVVCAPEHWSVGEAIDFLRQDSDQLPEHFYHVILVDPKFHPVGYVTLGKILSSARHVPLKDVTEHNFRTTQVDQDEADVAYAFNQYHLISMPVIDQDERLVGVITIDDAMAVLDEEHEEDILRLAGVAEESSLNDSTVDTVKRRLPWLLVNLCTANLAALVISQFDAVIAQIVALAILMPIVASMGGNAGTQSLTVAVRAIATKDLTSSNVLRVVRREAGVGLINGVVFACLMGVIATLWFSDPRLGMVISMAMIVNMFTAAFVGILVPVTLDRFGADPALASGTFVTTITDVVGFFTFLGLAAMVLI